MMWVVAVAAAAAELLHSRLLIPKRRAVQTGKQLPTKKGRKSKKLQEIWTKKTLERRYAR